MSSAAVSHKMAIKTEMKTTVLGKEEEVSVEPMNLIVVPVFPS